MGAYEFYWRDPKGRFQRIGVLTERRKNLMRITSQSVMNWGKMFLGNDVDSKDVFFKSVTVDTLAGGIFWRDLSNHPK